MDPKERAFAYIMHHLKTVDALDGDTDGRINMHKAKHYLDEEIKKQPSGSLEAQHLGLFKSMIEEYKGKEVRKLPPEWLLKLNVPTNLMQWFETHPTDPWQLSTPQTPTRSSGKSGKSRIE